MMPAKLLLAGNLETLSWLLILNFNSNKDTLEINSAYNEKIIQIRWIQDQVGAGMTELGAKKRNVV
jgi:hypothetical protein